MVKSPPYNPEDVAVVAVVPLASVHHKRSLGVLSQHLFAVRLKNLPLLRASVVPVVSLLVPRATLNVILRLKFVSDKAMPPLFAEINLPARCD